MYLYAPEIADPQAAHADILRELEKPEVTDEELFTALMVFKRLGLPIPFLQLIEINLTSPHTTEEDKELILNTIAATNSSANYPQFFH